MNTKPVDLETMLPLIREQLAQGNPVRFTPRGTSMEPMLRGGRDQVILSPIPGKLRRYDLPLYRRDNGQFVLHRVIGVGERYTCMGDNQFTPEEGIRQDQLLGLVTAFVREGKTHPVTSPAYRLYCRLWHRSRPLRHLIIRLKNKLSRLFRK